MGDDGEGVLVHRSRIAVVMIDHPETSYEPAAAFWAAARGSSRTPNDEPEYESLDRLPGNVALEMQRTGSGTPPRVHLDLEVPGLRHQLPHEVGRDRREQPGDPRVVRASPVVPHPQTQVGVAALVARAGMDERAERPTPAGRGRRASACHETR